MPGDILIVDSVATNRIVLKVKLLAAQHRVRPCESLAAARAEIAAQMPDLVLLDITADTDASLDFCRDLKATEAGRFLPVIATGGFLAPQDRLRALTAGADDVLARPFNDQLLQARIRSLLRARDAAQELRLREDTRRALGFAEHQASFVQPSSVQLVSPDPVFLHTHRATFGGLRGVQVEGARYHPTTGLREKLTADLFVIDARELAGPENMLYRLLSELRSRSDSRHAGILVVLPEDDPGAAAMALDLGANDIVTEGVVADEIALRARALITEKQRADLLRKTLLSGLEAAVTDPLTGLYNRRYALPHLQRMAERAEETRRDFAVMVLDIDHFKRLNDTWGHAAGDEVLRQVAHRLRSNLRAVDLLARIGGEEFLVALPDSDATYARVAAERLCRIVSEKPFRVVDDGAGIPVTMSIGVTVCHGGTGTCSGDAPDLMVREADRALYRAKGSGRNTVIMTAA